MHMINVYLPSMSHDNKALFLRTSTKDLSVADNSSINFTLPYIKYNNYYTVKGIQCHVQVP